jgi:hypothetical protein
MREGESWEKGYLGWMPRTRCQGGPNTPVMFTFQAC